MAGGSVTALGDSTCRFHYGAASRRSLEGVYGHDPVVRRLLWEIKGLQVVIMRARQLEQSLPPGKGTTDTGLILGALRRELAAESWLREWEYEIDTCGKMPP